jgi:hypothetical protein
VSTAKEALVAKARDISLWLTRGDGGRTIEHSYYVDYFNAN